MSSPTDQNRTKAGQDYFRLTDQGSREMLELFHEDAEIYFPKFGFGRQSFFELTKGFEGALEFIHHDYDNLRIIPVGDYVVVEGTSRGKLSGRTWTGGETPGGRAAVFAMSSNFVGMDCQACMSTLIRTTPGRMPPDSDGA
jgi:hypothetical protein